MPKDYRVTTWTSKQIGFSKQEMEDLTVGESAYSVVCLTPAERWYLLTLAHFYKDYGNRWEGFTQSERDELVSNTIWRMICPMACQEDIQAINTTLGLINATLIEVRNRLGDGDGDLDLRLQEMNTELEALTTAVTESFPSLIDKIEPILNGVGVILGAPTIPFNGA